MLTRLIGHLFHPRIQELENENAILAADFARASAEALDASIALLDARKHKALFDLTLDSLRNVNERISRELAVERLRSSELADRLAEAHKLHEEHATALEEANSRIALLEEAARRLSDEDEEEQQLALMNSPASKGEPETVQIDEGHIDGVCRLIGIYFEGRHFWELAFGKTKIKAAITDKTFLERMEKREVTFARGDAIRCRIKYVTTRCGDDVDAKFTIEQVLEIVSPEQQLKLGPIDVALPALAGGAA
jgi:hypothetical protein